VVGGAGDGCCVFYGDSCVGRRCGWLVGYARARGGRGEEVAGLIMEGDGCGLGVDGEGGRGKGGGRFVWTVDQVVGVICFSDASRASEGVGSGGRG